MDGVPERCETYYRWHQEVYGAPPGRNAMQRAGELRDFTEHTIRVAWETLSGKRRPPRRYRPKQKEVVVAQEQGLHAQDEHATLEEEADATPDEQVTSLAIGLVKQQRDYAARMAALEQTVQELRGLTMALASPKTSGLPAELVTAVGRLQADGARRDTQMQRLHDRVDELTRLVAVMQHTIAPLQTLRDLLTKDKVAWDTVLPMVMQHDRPYAEKAVRNWLESWTGRPLYKPTM